MKIAWLIKISSRTPRPSRSGEDCDAKKAELSSKEFIGLAEDASFIGTELLGKTGIIQARFPGLGGSKEGMPAFLASMEQGMHPEMAPGRRRGREHCL